MAVRSKGFYFSFDALMASLVVFFAFFTVMQMDTGQQGTLSSEYQQADTAAEDALQLALSSPFRTAFNKTEERQIVNDTELVLEDLNRSVMDVLAVLWASNETGRAQEVAKEYFSRIVPDEFAFRVRISNENTTTIYSSAPTFNGSNIVARSSRMVSGVSRNRPTRGFTAKASLTSLGAVQSRYFFFGGYVGDGNITANVTLPEYHNIVAAEMEGNFGGNFSLTINGQPAGTYDPSATNLSADRFTVCNRTYASSRCGAFTSEGNVVRFDFGPNGTSIGGGFFRVDYNDTESLQARSGTYVMDTDRFPGIRGIINIFSSFHVPGTLHGLSAELHYRANTTTFLKIGNVTVYSNTTEGETRVMLDNATLAERLAEANVSLAELSNVTVPIRLGVRNITNVEREEADSAAVIDVSGSMDTDQNNDGYTLLEEAKNASKLFVDIVLGVEENRAGMVAYESTVDDSYPLTRDKANLKNAIEALEAGGGTCIGCGILKATEVVQAPEWQRFIPPGASWEWTAAYPESEPPTRDGVAWTEVGYNDTDWNASETVAGFGSGAVDSVLPVNGGDYYFRKEFSWDWLDYNTFQGFVRSENAAAVYINGKLVDNDTGSHAARDWNRILNGLNPIFTDSFERDSLGANWTVTSGKEGDEVRIGTACGSTDGSRALIVRWDDATVETKEFDLSGRESLGIQYEVKQGGSGGCESPENGEDFRVQYLDSSGNWQTLKTHPGGGSDPTAGAWGGYRHSLPNDALHSGFKLRFRFPSGSGSDYDYWAVDSVDLGTSIPVNDSVIRDGKNVIAVKLKDDGASSTGRWRTDGRDAWLRGTFTNTTVRDGELTLQGLETLSSEGFEDGGLSPWSCDGTGSCDVSSSCAMEGTYAASHSAAEGSLVSTTHDLSGMDAVNVSFWVRKGSDSCSEAPEGNDNLVLQYLDGSGTWQDIRTFDANGLAAGATVTGEVSLPADALHDGFRLRFRQTQGSGTGYDFWHVDDVVLSSAAANVSSGTYTSRLFDAGVEVSWNDLSVANRTGSGASYAIDFWNGSRWFDTLPQVPDGRLLRFNVTLSTSSQTVVPAIDWTNVTFSGPSAQFDFGLNASVKRNRTMVVMSDGNANRETSMTDVPDHDGDGDVDADDHAIEAACRAWQNHRINVFTIAFGAGADNQTLQLAADCGHGRFFFASTGELTEVFKKISESILKATQRGQQLLLREGAVNQTLYPDSALELNYSQAERREFGKFRITQESPRFGGNVTSPKNGSFEVPQNTELMNARLLSYSSKYWTDRVLIQNRTGSWEYVYRLWKYGRQYDGLGDPYVVHIPPSEATVGAVNNVSVNTALLPNRTVGGSNYSRVVYDLLVDGFVGYGDVFSESTGGTTTVQTDYGNFTLEVGNATDAWEPFSDAVDNATERLLNKLDVDDDGSVDFQIDSDNLNIDQNSLSGLRWLWGPAIVSVEVWK